MVLVINGFFFRRFAGIALWPFIIVRSKEYSCNAVFMNHERIHLRQQLELLVLPFYVWYGLEYLLRLVYYKDRHKAYRNISFEREAYANEENLDYLKERRFWGFMRYLEK
jgi:hypothetical protein